MRRGRIVRFSQKAYSSACPGVPAQHTSTYQPQRPRAMFPTKVRLLRMLSLSPGFSANLNIRMFEKTTQLKMCSKPLADDRNGDFQA